MFKKFINDAYWNLAIIAVICSVSFTIFFGIISMAFFVAYANIESIIRDIKFFFRKDA